LAAAFGNDAALMCSQRRLEQSSSSRRDARFRGRHELGQGSNRTGQTIDEKVVPAHRLETRNKISLDGLNLPAAAVRPRAEATVTETVDDCL